MNSARKYIDLSYNDFILLINILQVLYHFVLNCFYSQGNTSLMILECQ